VAVAQGGTVSFQGAGNDPDNNTPLTYSWNFGGGAANSTAQNPGAVTFNTAGTFTVAFTVTDSLGLASTPVTRIVTVTGAGGQQPVAIIEEPNQSRTIARGRSIEFHGDADNTDDEDDELRFNWSFPGGTPATSTRDEVKVFFNTAGTFTVTLTVTDSQGRTSAPVSRVITVTGPANMTPTASIDAPAGDVSVAQGGTVNFMGTGTDPDGNTPLTYSWNFGGGAPNSTAQNPGDVTFDTAGTFTVTFTVTDSLGLSSEPVTRTVTVAPVGMPAAEIVAPAMNVSVLPRGKATFKGAAVGVDNPRFRWTFEGGNPKKSTRQNPGVVRFDKVGMHKVTLTVTDGAGVSLTPVTRVVTVARPNATPRVDDDCRDDRKDDRKRDDDHKKRDDDHKRDRRD
jgi:PKD repeat protein